MDDHGFHDYGQECLNKPKKIRSQVCCDLGDLNRENFRWKVAKIFTIRIAQVTIQKICPGIVECFEFWEAFLSIIVKTFCLRHYFSEILGHFNREKSVWPQTCKTFRDKKYF